MKNRANIIPPIPEKVKKKFLEEVLLTHDMIQESREDDELFQGEASLKWQLRAFIEYQRSPCIDPKHGHNEHSRIPHEICSWCRRIAWEALK